MGDNRNDSLDSRYWGFVPDNAIEGTPILIYMSIEAPGDAWQPDHIGDRVRAYAGAIFHPSRIRWKRLFHVF
jgi:signal peptidase I